MDLEAAKRLAAERALSYLPESGIIGLGTGSTVRYFIEGVARCIRNGRDLTCVPTSNKTRKLALELGIPLLDDCGPWDLDLTVDGADEVSASLDLIKGGGGAHTREKIVNYASRQNVIVVDDTKLSHYLGERHRLPVEVLRFAHRGTERALQGLGAAALRLEEGRPFETDSGNYLYDVTVGPISDPRPLESRIMAIPGVVSTGLFLARADRVIVARSQGGIEELEPHERGMQDLRK